MYRDLQPKRFIIESNGDIDHVRITDFYMASELNPFSKKLIYRCGSPGYVAPEVLNDQAYDTKADVFSAGAVMFALLTGRPLFAGKDVDSIIQKNKECNLNLKSIVWY